MTNKISTFAIACLILLSTLIILPSKEVSATGWYDHSVRPYSDDYEGAGYYDYERSEWSSTFSSTFSEIEVRPIIDNMGDTVGLVLFSFVPHGFYLNEEGDGQYVANLDYTLGVRVIVDPDTPQLWDDTHKLGIESVKLISEFNAPEYTGSNQENYNEVKIENKILHAGHSTVYGVYSPDFIEDGEINTADDLDLWNDEWISYNYGLETRDQVQEYFKYIKLGIDNSVGITYPWVRVGTKAVGYMLNLEALIYEDQNTPLTDDLAHNYVLNGAPVDYDTEAIWDYDVGIYEYRSVVSTNNWYRGRMTIEDWDPSNWREIHELFTCEIALENEQYWQITVESFDYDVVLDNSPRWSLPSIPKSNIISATGITDSSFTLNWEENPLDFLYQNYHVYVSTDPAFVPDVDTTGLELVSTQTPKDNTAFLVTGLNQVTTYYCTIITETKETDSTTGKPRFSRSDVFQVTTKSEPPIIDVKVADYGWFSSDPGSIINVEFTNNGGSDLDYARYKIGAAGTWQNIFTTDTPSYTTDWSVDWAALSEGVNTIYIEAYNLEGTVNSATITFKKDTVGPSCSIFEIVSGGYSYVDGTNIHYRPDVSTSFTIKIAASDASSGLNRAEGGEVFGMTPIDNTLSATTPEFNLFYNYDIPGGDSPYDGLLTITVYDNAGNSNACTVTFISDVLPPPLDMTINNGASYTTSQSVTLNINAPDADSMRFGYTPTKTTTSSFSRGSSHPYEPNTDMTWILPGVGNGVGKTMYHFYQLSLPVNDMGNRDYIYLWDEHGNSQTFTYINNGSPWTIYFEGTVRIKLVSGAGTQDYGFHLDKYTTNHWTSWQSFSSTKSWTLQGSSSGTKTVYCEIQDSLGQIVSDSDSIYHYIHQLNLVTSSTSSISLSWSRYPGADFIRYDLHRSGSASFTPSSSNKIYSTTEPSSTSYSDSGLASSTKYYYKLAVYKSSGTIWTASEGRTAKSGGGGGGGAACPYIYTWDGSDYVIDNNVLPESEKYQRGLLDVEDSYVLSSPLVEKDELLQLGIYEFENEHSFFDKLSLTAIDHPIGTRMSQNTNGDTIGYNDNLISPISAIRSDIVSVSSELSTEDDWSIVGEKDDWVLLDFGTINNFDQLKLVIRANSKLEGSYSPNIHPPPSFPKLDYSLRVQYQNINDEWTDIDSISPREEYSNSVVNLDGYFSPGQDIVIQIYWTKFHRLDFVGLDTGSEVSFSYSNTELINANHSRHGDVTTRLHEVDEIYSETQPTDWLHLNFSKPETLSTGYERSYIFNVTGHYYTVKYLGMSQEVDVEVQLQNYDISTEALVIINRQNGAYDIEAVAQATLTSINSSVSISFDRFPDYEYSMAIIFDNSLSDTLVETTLSSGFGAETIITNYDADLFIYEPISDELISMTGSWSHPLSKNISVYKNVEFNFEVMGRPVPWYTDYNNGNMTSIHWDFGDGNESYELSPSHAYTSPGEYLVICNMTFYYEERFVDVTEYLLILVPIVEPEAVIEIYQEVDLNLRIAGRKDNSVTVNIFEDGILIDEVTLTRTSGQPNEATIPIKKYIDKTYSFTLVYEAVHKGSNPTKLTFISGDEKEKFSYKFKTKNGFYQTIDVDSSLFYEVTEENYEYIFDASESYDIDGEIIAYEWDFGDGTVATGSYVVHQYFQDMDDDDDHEDDDDDDEESDDDRDDEEDDEPDDDDNDDHISAIFQITLTVRDDDGTVATISQKVEVS